jgi:iron complex outermembrane receptor protein
MLTTKQIFVSTVSMGVLLGSFTVASAQQAATSAALQTPGAHTGIEEVVVTARRRAERAQTTPVSVSVLSASKLKQQNVTNIQDLNDVVPGFHFNSNGGENTDDVVLRGLSRIPLGLGIPAVVTYFSDVPLPGIASNVPFFDIGSVQVLKGPQGTLFGRNALGGAVVITPEAPTDKIGGYIDGQIGNYGHEFWSGAVNIPIVPDKVELRVSGQIRRQDGYVKSLNSDARYSDINEDSYRVDLLLKPTDYIRSTTIFDYSVSPQGALGSYLYSTHPGVVPGLSPLIDPQIAKYFAIQKAAGPYYAFDDGIGNGVEFSRSLGVLNDTRYDLDDNLQVRNIVSFRKVFNNEEINTGGVPTLSIPTPVGPLPFTLFNAGQTQNQQYFTDELQLIGHAWDNRINWILGGFVNDDSPAGGNGSQFTAFSVGGVPAQGVTALVTDHNYALYGQTAVNLSDYVLDGLTFNIGYRYSWDQVHACGGTIPSVPGYANSDQCEDAAKLGTAGTGAGDIGAEGSEPSWTIGLDYKLNDHQFFYITSRRGYRGVNVNTPLFTSPYTTGGVVVPPFIGGPGCTGPGNRCPDLRPFQKTGPEKLTDLEIGSKTDFHIGSMTGRFDIDGYIEYYQGALQFFNVAGTGIYLSAPDLPTNQSVGVNAADETEEGVEASLILQPLEGLTVDLEGAYSNAVVDRLIPPPVPGLALTKSQITLPTPRFSGSAIVSYLAPVHPLQGDLIFNADWYQTGKFSGQYGVSLPGYGVGNARLALNNIYGTHFDLSLFVNNILDRAYLQSPIVLLQTFPVSTVAFAQPRIFGVELRYTF